MQMLSRLSFLVALMASGLALSSTPIHGADTPSWTGLYVGAGLGFRSTEAGSTVTGKSQQGIEVLSANCAFFASSGGCVTGEPLNDATYRISPYIGFNWQFAPRWVAGIEADRGFAGKTTTLTGMRYPVTTEISNQGGESFSVRTKWDASIRGRIGFLATPSVLFYATGGAAWLHVETTSVCNPGINFLCSPPATSGPLVITDATNKVGWTAGGGVEAMLSPNWVARGEYRYADYGTISATDRRTLIGFIDNVVSHDLQLKTHTASFGLAYKFGSQPGVAAMDSAPAEPVSTASWSGVHLGLGVGARATNAASDITGFTTGGGNNLAACDDPGFVGGCVTGAPLNNTAFRISPYAGIDWQIAPRWLVGLEADWGFADKTKTLGGRYYPFSAAVTGRAADSFSVRSTWDASLRGRAGFLVNPSTLIYATGGAAWLHVEATSTCSTNSINGDCGPGQLNDPVITHAVTKTGWTLGGGVEARLGSNWVARAEYRYADFGNIAHTDTRTSPVPGLQIVSYDLAIRTHTAQLGIAYNFDWSYPASARR
jgi:outer membrane immunogenic protein